MLKSNLLGIASSLSTFFVVACLSSIAAAQTSIPNLNQTGADGIFRDFKEKAKEFEERAKASFDQLKNQESVVPQGTLVQQGDAPSTITTGIGSTDSSSASGPKSALIANSPNAEGSAKFVLRLTAFPTGGFAGFRLNTRTGEAWYLHASTTKWLKVVDTAPPPNGHYEISMIPHELDKQGYLTMIRMDQVSGASWYYSIKDNQWFPFQEPDGQVVR